MNIFRSCLRAAFGLLVLLTVTVSATAQHSEQAALVLTPDQPQSFSPTFARAVASAIQNRWADLNPTSPPPLFFVGLYPPQEIDYPQLVMLRFTGTCDVLPQISVPHTPRPLGYVQFVDGHALNYITVDCAEIAKTIDEKIRPMKPQQRLDAMARAISRVFEHEYLHIVRQSAHHDQDGVGRAQLTAGFLVAPETLTYKETFNAPTISGSGF